MPEPYKGNRGEAIGYIGAMIDEGMSNTAIVNFLRDNDLSYRTQSMFQDINRLRLENMGAVNISNMDRDTPVPDRFMRDWYGSTEYQYRVVIKYSYFDTNTMTTGTSGTTMYFDHPPSQAEVMEHWDVRRQTVEQMYNNVQEVYGATKIMYFRNVSGEGE